MNSKYLIPTLILFGLIGTYFFIQSGKSDKTEPADNSDAMMVDDAKNTMDNEEMMADDSTMMEASRYIEYSPDAFAAAADKKRVYFFYAPWCPTCVPTDKEFNANLSKIPEDVMLFRTDYDTSTELKQQYGITYQHTFVQVDSDGNEVKKWNGGGINELIANTQ